MIFQMCFGQSLAITSHLLNTEALKAPSLVKTCLVLGVVLSHQDVKQGHINTH